MIWQSRTSERNLDNLPEENACEEADECVHNAIGMTQKQTSLHLFVKDLRSSLQGILWFDIKETLRNWIDGNGCWLSRVDPILLSPTESYWVLLSPTESYWVLLYYTSHAWDFACFYCFNASVSHCRALTFLGALPGGLEVHMSHQHQHTSSIFSCRKHLIVAHTNHGTLLCDEDLAPIDQNQKMACNRHMPCCMI